MPPESWTFGQVASIALCRYHLTIVNLNRRSLIFSLFGASALVLHSQLGLSKLQRSKSGTSCLITIGFPAGVGPKEFVAQREHWGAVKEFEDAVKLMISTGAMASKSTTIGESSAVYRFEFTSPMAHDFFVWKIRSTGLVNFNKLTALGYTFNRTNV